MEDKILLKINSMLHTLQESEHLNYDSFLGILMKNKDTTLYLIQTWKIKIKANEQVSLQVSMAIVMSTLYLKIKRHFKKMTHFI